MPFSARSWATSHCMRAGVCVCVRSLYAAVRTLLNGKLLIKNLMLANCVLDKGGCCQFSSSTLFRKIKILHADKLLLISILLFIWLLLFFLFFLLLLVSPFCVVLFFLHRFLFHLIFGRAICVSMPAFCPFCDLTALKLLELFPNK